MPLRVGWTNEHPGISAFVTQDETIEVLANAYGVAVSVDAIADAIISDSELSAGVPERDALIAVVIELVGSEGAIEAIRTGAALPQGTLPAMTEAARSHLIPTDKAVPPVPEVSPAALVEMATRSLRSQLI